MRIGAYFSRHAQVLIGSLGRIVHQPFATLMTMGVIAVALALPLFLSLLLQNARSATGNWNEAYDLSVYMDKKAVAVRTQSLAKQSLLNSASACSALMTRTVATSLRWRSCLARDCTRPALRCRAIFFQSKGLNW